MLKKKNKKLVAQGLLPISVGDPIAHINELIANLSKDCELTYCTPE